MDKLFTAVVNMSVTGSFVILAVLLARFFLRKSPKIFSYALWAVVLFRLLCPVSLPSPLSVLPEGNTGAGSMEYVALVETDTGRIWEPVFYHSGNTVPTPPPATVEPTMHPLTAIWLTGAALLAAVNIGLLLRWRRHLQEAIPLEGNVWLADAIPTPFVLGVLSPKIYLPSALEEREREYILRHERHHIRRLDHITRLLAFGAVCIHWFNPLVWLAYSLSGRDMEMSCDEAVLRSLREDVRADYSYTLLKLTTGKRFAMGTPLAFGEGDTKERVKNIMKFRKPTMLAAVLCLVLRITLTACLTVNPEPTETTPPPETTQPVETTQPTETTPVETPPEETVKRLASYGPSKPLSELMDYPPDVSAMTKHCAELLYSDDSGRIIFCCYDSDYLFGYDYVKDELFLSIWLKRIFWAHAAMPSWAQRGLIYISPDGNTILLHDWKDNVYRYTFKLDLAAGTYRVKEGYDALEETFEFPENHTDGLRFGPSVESMRYTNGNIDCYIFRNNTVKYDGPGPLKDILMDAIDLDTPTGIGFILAYEDERTIIFYGQAGLFGYDLYREKLTFAIDVEKLMGVEAQFEGTGRAAGVSASKDGKTLYLTDCGEGNRGLTAVYKTAVIDLENRTYELDTTYRIYDGTQHGKEIFSAYDENGDPSTQGYVFPGIDLGTTCYVRGEQKWYPFR